MVKISKGLPGTVTVRSYNRRIIKNKKHSFAWEQKAGFFETCEGSHSVLVLRFNIEFPKLE